MSNFRHNPILVQYQNLYKCQSPGTPVTVLPVNQRPPFDPHWKYQTTPNEPHNTVNTKPLQMMSPGTYSKRQLIRQTLTVMMIQCAPTIQTKIPTMKARTHPKMTTISPTNLSNRQIPLFLICPVKICQMPLVHLHPVHLYPSNDSDLSYNSPSLVTQIT